MAFENDDDAWEAAQAYLSWSRVSNRREDHEGYVIDNTADFHKQRDKILKEIEDEEKALMKEFFGYDAPDPVEKQGGARKKRLRTRCEDDSLSTTIEEDKRPYGKLEFADPKVVEKLLKTIGTHSVEMADGSCCEINTFGNGRTFSFVGKKCSKRKVSPPKIRSKKENAVAVPTDCFIVVDGSNVIGIDEELRTKILQSIVEALKKSGYESKVFVDKTIFGWLRNKKQDESGAKYLADGEKEGLIIVAPNKAEADGQILQLAEFEKNAHIITNDHYRDYAEMHPWLNDRGAANRLHGINLVPMGNGKFRILIVGFNLDITVNA